MAEPPAPREELEKAASMNDIIDLNVGGTRYSVQCVRGSSQTIFNVYYNRQFRPVCIARLNSSGVESV